MSPNGSAPGIKPAFPPLVPCFQILMCSQPVPHCLMKSNSCKLHENTTGAAYRLGAAYGEDLRECQCEVSRVRYARHSMGAGVVAIHLDITRCADTSIDSALLFPPHFADSQLCLLSNLCAETFSQFLGAFSGPLSPSDFSVQCTESRHIR